MKRLVIAIVLTGLLAFLAAGCNNGQKAGDGTKASVPETSLSIEDTDYKPEINPADFSTTVDNEYLPLAPGTTLIYEGDTGDGAEQIEVAVTSKTKKILGVACVEVRDTVTIDGNPVEETLAAWRHEGGAQFCSASMAPMRVLIFSPIHYPIEQLPGWLASTHRVLPFKYMADLMRGYLIGRPPVDAGLAFAVIGAWCAIALVVTSIAVKRRR